MKEPRILYITTKDRDEARRIGEILVKAHLCACVNIISHMESVYWWDDEIQYDAECILLVKTTDDFVQSITDRIKQEHSYEVPCVISLPLSPEEGNREYLNWIADSVRS